MLCILCQKKNAMHTSSRDVRMGQILWVYLNVYKFGWVIWMNSTNQIDQVRLNFGLNFLIQ